MSRWFRHYAGMMRDDKLVRAALKAKQPVERVVWVWGAILESAAEIDDGGRYELDAAEAAYFLRSDETDICAVLDALASLGRVAEGCVVKWGDRQYQSDRSAARQAAYRERKRSGDGGGDGGQEKTHVASDGRVTSPTELVTAMSRHGDAPETETETETETELETEKETKAAQPTEPREKELGGIPVALWRGSRTSEWFDQVEAECREAAGLENDPSSALCNPSPIVTLIDKGYDFARDILPVLRAFKAKGKAGKTWDYYVAAITDGKDRNDRIAPKPQAISVTPTIWLDEGDARFLSAAAAYERLKGHKVTAHGSRNRSGIGFEFPASCLSPITEEKERAA